MGAQETYRVLYPRRSLQRELEYSRIIITTRPIKLRSTYSRLDPRFRDMAKNVRSIPSLR